MSNSEKQNNKAKRTIGDIIESTYGSQKKINDSLKSIQPALKNISEIEWPTFHIPEFPEIEFTSPEITQEENMWKRHEEIIEVQGTIIEIQKAILDDQRSNKKYVIVGLILSGLAALFAFLALIPVLRAFFLSN